MAHAGPGDWHRDESLVPRPRHKHILSALNPGGAHAAADACVDERARPKAPHRAIAAAARTCAHVARQPRLLAVFVTVELVHQHAGGRELV